MGSLCGNTLYSGKILWGSMFTRNFAIQPILQEFSLRQVVSSIKPYPSMHRQHRHNQHQWPHYCPLCHFVWTSNIVLAGTYRLLLSIIPLRGFVKVLASFNVPIPVDLCLLERSKAKKKVSILLTSCSSQDKSVKQRKAKYVINGLFNWIYSNYIAKDEAMELNLPSKKGTHSCSMWKWMPV